VNHYHDPGPKPMQSLSRVARAYWPFSERLLFGAALVVRLLALGVLPEMTITPDLEEYRYLARAVSARGEYAFASDWQDNAVLRQSPWPFYYDRTGMVRSPGYPLFIAAVESILGRSDRALQYSLAIVDALSAAFIGRIAALLFDRGIGATAGLLYAFNPNAIQ
jgi:hypothetical protein